MPTFDAVTREQAAAVIRPPTWLEANRAYAGVPDADDPNANPDHWQGGDGLAAPLPVASDPLAAAYTNALEATFVAEDCVGDVLERRRNGLLGKEPGFTAERDEAEEREDDETPAETPEGEESEAEEEEVDEELERVNDALAAWWDETGAHEVFKRWLDGLGYGGRSYLRLFVPHGRLTEGPNGPTLAVSTPEEALRHIYPEHLDADEAGLHLDRATRLPMGVVAIASDAEFEPDTEASAEDTTYEIVYPAGFEVDAATVIRTTGVTSEEDVSWTLDLGGRMTLFEGRLKPLIDDHMRRNQRDLNTKRTMLAISDTKAGFPSLVFIGVAPPTEPGVDANGNPVEVPASYENGPGQVGFFVAQTDSEGKSASASVTQFGPVDNTNLRASADVARVAIYRRAKQLHALALAGANLSGEAMVQAQGEFLADLMDCKAIADRAGKWMLETAWAFAEAIATGRSTRGLKVVFDCRPHAGPLTSAMRQQILNEYDKGVYSLATTQSLLGVDDVEAERARMEDERERDPDVVRAREADAAFLAERAALAGVIGGDGASGEPVA